MKTVALKIGSPRYRRWLDTAIVSFGPNSHYTRDTLNDIGVGLHTQAARRLADAVEEHGLTLGMLFKMGWQGFRRLDGIGETTGIVAAFILIQHGYDAMAWIGEKGRTYKGAMANAKAKSKSRIPGRSKRQGKK